MKDAKSLVSLDNGERLDYFDTVRTMWVSENNDPHLHKIVGNWYVFDNSDLLLDLDSLNIGFFMNLVAFSIQPIFPSLQQSSRLDLWCRSFRIWTRERSQEVQPRDSSQ